MPNLGVARLCVSRRGQRSVVVRQYSQAPLQLHRPLYLNGGSSPVVYLKTPSSGLLAGDAHELHVEIEADGALELRTQADTLVYPGSSSHLTSIRLGERAQLRFLPHQFILAAQAKLKQKVRIELSPESVLAYSDAWCAGRIAMGECWQFELFDYELEIWQAGAILFRERFILNPRVTPVKHALICGDLTRFRSTFEIGPQSRLAKSPERMAYNPLAAVRDSACGAALDAGTGLNWTLERNTAVVRRFAGSN